MNHQKNTEELLKENKELKLRLCAAQEAMSRMNNKIDILVSKTTNNGN